MFWRKMWQLHRHPLFALRPPIKGLLSEGEGKLAEDWSDKLAFYLGVCAVFVTIIGFLRFKQAPTPPMAFLVVAAMAYLSCVVLAFWIFSNRLVWLVLGYPANEYPRSEAEWRALSNWACGELWARKCRFEREIQSVSELQTELASCAADLNVVALERNVAGPTHLRDYRQALASNKRLLANVEAKLERANRRVALSKKKFLAAWDLFKEHGVAPTASPKEFLELSVRPTPEQQPA